MPSSWYGIPSSFHLYTPSVWYGRTSTFSTLSSVSIKSWSLCRYSSLSLLSGTRTWRIQTGFPVSERYLAISRIFLFVCPVRILCCSSSICLISSITRSVTFISSWNLLKNGSSLVNGFPQVSSVVLIPLSLAFWNNSSRKSICRSGSPPLTVIPPLLPQ